VGDEIELLADDRVRVRVRVCGQAFRSVVVHIDEQAVRAQKGRIVIDYFVAFRCRTQCPHGAGERVDEKANATAEDISKICFVNCRCNWDLSGSKALLLENNDVVGAIVIGLSAGQSGGAGRLVFENSFAVSIIDYKVRAFRVGAEGERLFRTAKNRGTAREKSDGAGTSEERKNSFAQFHILTVERVPIIGNALNNMQPVLFQIEFAKGDIDLTPIDTDEDGLTAIGL